MAIELNQSSLDGALKSDLPIVVDFWAPWCAPCKEVAPIFNKLEAEFRGKLTFAKLNVDDNREIASKFGIRGIPCLIIFNSGQEIERIIGGMSEQDLRKKLDLALTKI